jgi:hypothetical protein
MAASPFAIPSVFRFERLFVPQMGQGPQIAADGKDHIATPAPIAPGRPALGGIFFPAKGHTPVPASPGRNFYQRLISKFLHFLGNSGQLDPQIIKSKFNHEGANGEYRMKKRKLPLYFPGSMVKFPSSGMRRTG